MPNNNFVYFIYKKKIKANLIWSIGSINIVILKTFFKDVKKKKTKLLSIW